MGTAENHHVLGELGRLKCRLEEELVVSRAYHSSNPKCLWTAQNIIVYYVSRDLTCPYLPVYI